ncbi:hypothetical protein OROHE_006382 [Orobanche hederae]
MLVLLSSLSKLMCPCMNPTFVLLILDLSMEHGVDLSWYPQPDRLADSTALMNTAQGELVPEDGGVDVDPPGSQD